jgi:tRNA pseudouridine synthase 10
MTSLLELASALDKREPLCDRCLGRCFARLGTGLTNEERGRALRVVLAMLQGGEPKAVKPEECAICRGLFRRVEEWAERAFASVAGYEFRTYLVGTRLPPEVEEAEKALWERHGISPKQAEPLKQELNREVGKRLRARLISQGTEATVDLECPDVAFLLDLERDVVEPTVNPLYLYGRYRKLVRGIPQTKWPCRKCRGRGCPECGYTGRQYPESVEELIAAPVLEAAQGAGHALHGAGREDIDARMLGRGRPFVLEIERPRRRSLDLEELERAINERAQGKVEVQGLKLVDRRAVEAVKEMEGKRKVYRARVEFERPVTQQELHDALQKLVGEVQQRTPRRVSHRRADLVRTRRVFAIKGEVTGEREAVIEVVAEGGLYVKELVSGDEGRTRPSLAELLGTQAQVTELDVLDVLGEVPFEDPLGTEAT